jgi:nucleoside-diphosphate-sugar epimerase
VRAIVVRPGLVYGGDSGVVSDMLRDACNGIVRVVGSGDNHWPLIYRDDLADLFVRLIGHADIAGIVHATDGSDDTVNDLVEAMSSHVTHKPEVRHMSISDARHRMGALAERWRWIRSSAARRRWASAGAQLTSASRNVPRLLESGATR